MSIGMTSYDKHMATIPSSWIKCLFIEDELAPLRQQALNILVLADDIHNAYRRTEHHPAVTPEVAWWGLERNEHTTLRTTRDEPESFMERMGFEATHPVARLGITWGDGDGSPYTNKLGPLIRTMASYQRHIRAGAVLDYPHGANTPEEAWRNMHNLGANVSEIRATLPAGVELIFDVDTVIRYRAWMQGNPSLVQEILHAEAEAAKTYGFIWKAIQKVTVHAFHANKDYPGDPFKSVFRSTWMTMEAGAIPKSSTGVNAEPPYHDFVKQDTGPLFRVLGMLAAVSTYNAKHGTRFWIKFSGGIQNEADIAVFRMAAREFLGDDVANLITFGSSFGLRKRLMNYLLKADPGDPRINPNWLLPYGVDIAALPQWMGFVLPKNSGLDFAKAPGLLKRQETVSALAVS